MHVDGLKTLALFGSTGSIGRNALDVVRHHPDCFSVRYLTTNNNVELLAEQVREFQPSAVAVYDPRAWTKAKELFGGTIEIMQGLDGLLDIARRPDYDTMISALVGFAGLQPTIAAIESGRDIALANKETLVVAGELVTSLSRRQGIQLVPIDSEHSAILQCLVGEPPGSVARIILTASGGPFRGWSHDALASVTTGQALNHPNWKMGSKITIDSATLMNKGLEVIEAHWLFGLPADRIDVILHPQSIIHSMVEFTDGSIKAQLGVPDMKLPIHYALTHPDRLHSTYDRLDFRQMAHLTFEEPDHEVFRCLSLAYKALGTGGTAPACLNAANEIAVDAFLRGVIRFPDIPSVIEDCLASVRVLSAEDVETIIAVDEETRLYARECLPLMNTVSVTIP